MLTPALFKLTPATAMLKNTRQKAFAAAVSTLPLLWRRQRRWDIRGLIALDQRQGPGPSWSSAPVSPVRTQGKLQGFLLLMDVDDGGKMSSIHLHSGFPDFSLFLSFMRL